MENEGAILMVFEGKTGKQQSGQESSLQKKYLHHPINSTFGPSKDLPQGALHELLVRNLGTSAFVAAHLALMGQGPGFGSQGNGAWDFMRFPVERPRLGVFFFFVFVP